MELFQQAGAIIAAVLSNDAWEISQALRTPGAWLIGFGATAVGAALDASAQGRGLNNALNLPHVLAVLVYIEVLDFLSWSLHLATHLIPLLWRLHRVHHVDRDVDVTTAIRTLEIPTAPRPVSLTRRLKAVQAGQCFCSGARA